MIRGTLVLAAVAVVATACHTNAGQLNSHASVPGASMSTNDSTCIGAIRNLADGRITEAALPGRCSLAEAAGAIPGLAEARDASGTLGTDRVPMRWRAIASGIAGEQLRMWHDGVKVVAVEVEGPRPAGGWEALRAAIGAPEAKLEYWNGVVKSADGQWVYGARGLAVFTSLADTRVVRIVAFAPTTVETYRATLARGLEAPREFEEP